MYGKIKIVEMVIDSLAGSTFIGPVTKVAEWTVLDTVLVAFALTNEVEGDLHLLRKSQGLYLDDLRLALFRTALRCHTDAKHHLGMKGRKGESLTQRAKY